MSEKNQIRSYLTLVFVDSASRNSVKCNTAEVALSNDARRGAEAPG